MQVIKKDIEWLLEKVPDFSTFISENNKYIKEGGYVAGGFLRKCIIFGSVEAAINSISYQNKGDIDWFFHYPDGCLASWNHFAHRNLVAVVPSKEPNSITKFAFEGTSNNGIKHQFIYKSYGKPETVLNRFDISNCKIATNGTEVWMVEDWEYLEQNKIIRVDNFAGEYLVSRLRKYLFGDYTIYEPQTDELIAKMLSSAEKYQNVVRNLVVEQEFMQGSTILLFFKKLGEIAIHENPNTAYEMGSLCHTEDFAMHMYNKKNLKQSS